MSLLEVNIIPNSNENKIIFNEKNEITKIKINKPAVDGKANKELIKILEKHFNLKARILKGFSGKKKLILLE